MKFRSHALVPMLSLAAARRMHRHAPPVKKSKTKAKEKQITHRHKITYELDQDVRVVVLAEMGRSTKHITHLTGLSESQVNYRLTKAKRAEGLKQGYRTGWREGTSAAAQMADKLLSGRLQARVQTELPPLFTKPKIKVTHV